MKLHEIKQLDEASLKQLATAGIAAGSLFGPIKSNAPHANIIPYQPQNTHVVSAPQPEPEPKKQEQKIYPIAIDIAKHYRVSPQLVSQVIDIADQHSFSDFPKTKDILAIVGIESSFNPNAKSQLKKDPAVGLMQVRPGVWEIADEDIDEVEEQIAHGARILRKYYKSLKDPTAAIKAYNIGLTNFLRGQKQEAGERYLNKFRAEVARYTKT